MLLENIFTVAALCHWHLNTSGKNKRLQQMWHYITVTASGGKMVTKAAVKLCTGRQMVSVTEISL